MRLKSMGAFLVAVAVSWVAAGHRWGDSGHAAGVISAQGGSARHPVILESGRGRYALIATARVIPPFSGDVHVALDGEPAMGCQVFLTEPVVDLSLHERPELRDNVIRGLRPGDRLALWLVVEPHPGERADGRYDVVLRDTGTGRAVLSIPVIFRGETADGDGRHS